jgi:hypothetical protein
MSRPSKSRALHRSKAASSAWWYCAPAPSGHLSLGTKFGTQHLGLPAAKRISRRLRRAGCQRAATMRLSSVARVCQMAACSAFGRAPNTGSVRNVSWSKLRAIPAAPRTSAASAARRKNSRALARSPRRSNCSPLATRLSFSNLSRIACEYGTDGWLVPNYTGAGSPSREGFPPLSGDCELTSMASRFAADTIGRSSPSLIFDALS